MNANYGIVNSLDSLYAAFDMVAADPNRALYRDISGNIVAKTSREINHNYTKLKVDALFQEAKQYLDERKKGVWKSLNPNDKPNWFSFSRSLATRIEQRVRSIIQSVKPAHYPLDGDEQMHKANFVSLMDDDVDKLSVIFNDLSLMAAEKRDKRRAKISDFSGKLKFWIWSVFRSKDSKIERCLNELDRVSNGYAFEYCKKEVHLRQIKQAAR